MFYKTMYLRSVIFIVLFFSSAFTLMSQVNVFPIVKDFSVPPFPPAARAVNAEGDVFISVEVDENGTVLDAKPMQGHPLLRAAARAAAQKWTFTATGGRHFLTLRFMFRLGESRDMKESKLIGSYTLSNIEPKYRIIQTISYTSRLDQR